jgi:glycine cleavage system regulatory protein
MRGLIFTLIGKDRPGIVDAVADCIERHGGSWEESQLIRLHGQFAGIVHAEVPDDRRDALRAALSDLPNLKTVIADAAEQDGPRGTVKLDLIGADRPGIIHQIGHVLAERGVNLDEVTTTTERAPMSGEPMFRVHALLTVPEGQSVGDLRGALEALANELMVELTLQE